MTQASDPLGRYQHWMLGALMQPRATNTTDLSDILLPGAQLNAAACLAIYQRSYRLRLRLCLGEQFPASRHALGQALFDDFADEYLLDCPSDSYTLYELGRRFADWLESSRPDAGSAQREGWIDFMVDLARYERVLFDLYDAPGREGLPWPAAGCDDDRIQLQPCLKLVHYRFPVAAYYHAVRARQSPDLPEAAAFHAVILRRDYQTATYPVSAFHYRFLQAVQMTGSVGQALKQIATRTGHSLAAVTDSWHREVKAPWIDAGFFIATTN